LCLLGALPSSGRASASGVSITLYNAQHEQTTNALVAAFEKQTGIDVKVRNDDEDVLADQIVTEGSRSPADVIYTENSPVLEYLQLKGRLARVDASTLAAVPARYSSPQGKWVAVSGRVSGLVYNPKLIKASQVPRSVMDLAKPFFKDKLAIAPSETDFQPIISSIANRYGQKRALAWLEAIKQNAAKHNYANNEMLVARVNAGQASIGIINNYYWYRLRVELGASAMHSVFAYLAPRDAGYVFDVSGAGILSSSAHQRAAQKFLAFLVSKTGERIIATGDSFEYPLGSSVRTTKTLRPLSDLAPDTETIAELGDGQGAITLLERAGLL
jgi:iron(III) transport system substrate-binding protein